MSKNLPLFFPEQEKKSQNNQISMKGKFTKMKYLTLMPGDTEVYDNWKRNAEACDSVQKIGSHTVNNITWFSQRSQT